MLAKGYHQAGHSVEIASLDPTQDITADLSIPVHALGRSSEGYGYSPRLRTWLRQNLSRFDGAIVDGLWQYHGLAALQEMPGRLPYVVFTHGMLDPWFNRTYPLKALKKLPYWLLVERRLLRDSTAVLFTSTVERDLAPQSFPGSRWKSVVVPFGTDGPPQDAASELRALHERVPEVGSDPFLLFVGRIHPKKGCDLLLDAYAQVHGEQELPRLVFAGPDATGWQARLEERARTLGITSRVVWAGMLRGPQKWGAFRAAEAMVLPSHQENFGIVVAEALSCNTPVLISNQVNIYRDVERHGAGLTAPDTLEGTMDLLRGWARMPAAAREQMRTRAGECWQSCFNSARTPAAIVAALQGAGTWRRA